MSTLVLSQSNSCAILPDDTAQPSGDVKKNG